MSTDRTTDINLRDMPRDDVAQFKAYCARRGYTMKGAILALMRRARLSNDGEGLRLEVKKQQQT